MEAQIEQWEAGYSSPGGYAVCAECAKDGALADLIEANADDDECSFCGRREEGIAADTEIVLQRIGSQLLIEWDRAENLLYYDDETESGYAGPVYEIRDVLEFEGVEFGNERFEEFILDAFRETQFTPSGVYATTQGEALRFGWDDLVRTVKHQQRFFFVLAPNDRRADGAGVPVPRGLELLGELSRLIREYGLLRELPAGTALFRARTHSVRQRYESAKELGSPPPSAASQSRMSPAGIPMLYTADSAETAIAEIVGARRTLRKGVTVAVFEPTEPMQIVDFSRLPEFPSVFEDSPDVPGVRQELGFLYGMRRDIGLEVKLDGREHVDYVPTQVVCEYIRHQLPAQLGSPVHGLAWESTRVSGSLNMVLFLGQSRCVEAGERPAMTEGPLVELVRHERRRLQ
jgi:RES domain/HEPN/RES N-terminal domain 1